MHDKTTQSETVDESMEPVVDSESRPAQTWAAADYQSAELLQFSGKASAPAGNRSAAAAQAEALREANERPVVQAKDGKAPAGVQQAARKGVEGTGRALPHLGAIQQSFGQHDVGDVQAHVGGAAADASDAMGAQAYATGNDVAFRAEPDLHTAAHEAAHVVQQRGGVQLKGGVGQSGDAYENHADRVADAVVRGESAEGLLDRHAGPTATAPAQAKTQMKKEDGESGASEAATQPNPHTGKVLKRGSRGAAVVFLQSKLIEAGASITADGDFGPGTHAAVKAFQRAAGMSEGDVDGIVGAKTWSALDGGSTPEIRPETPSPEKTKEEAPPEKPKEEAPPEKAKEEAPPPQSDIEERARLDAAGKAALAALPKTSAADSAKTPGNVGQGDAEAGSHLPGWFMEIQNRLVASTVWGAPQEEAQNAIRDFAMFLARTTGDGKVPAHLKVFFDYIGRGTKNDRSARQEGYKSTAALTGAEGARNWCAGAAHRAKAIAKTEGREALLEHLASLGLKPICIPAVFFHNLEVRSGASKAKSFYGTTAYSEPLEPGDRIDYLFDGCQYGGHAVNVVADLGGTFLHVSGNTTKHSAVGIGQANRLLQKPPNLNLTTATDIRSAQTKQKASAHISSVSFGGGKLVYMIQRMTDPHKALEMLETEDPAQFAKACKTLLLKKV